MIQYAIYSYFVVLTVLSILPQQWALNLYMLLTILSGLLFISAGSIAQKGIRDKTAAKPAKNGHVLIAATITFGINMLICGALGAWFKVVVWLITALVTASTAIEKKKYIKYLKEKETNGDVPGMCGEESKA